MAKLKIKVSGGVTQVTIDGKVISGCLDFVVRCRGDNNISLSFRGTPFGADLSSEEGEIEVNIPDVLANALKG